MFKIKINKKEPTVPRCVVYDLITCNLPDSKEGGFFVEKVNDHGVIFGHYLETSLDNAVLSDSTIVWPHGENYDILCSMVPENWVKF